MWPCSSFKCNPDFINTSGGAFLLWDTHLVSLNTTIAEATQLNSPEERSALFPMSSGITADVKDTRCHMAAETPVDKQAPAVTARARSSIPLLAWTSRRPMTGRGFNSQMSHWS
ncbi:hypothetical protein BgiMline_007804 [Biomphalaria glabrata]|nr:hypothetical protein BgiMline_018498 [Biomphalaria glabrata]